MAYRVNCLVSEAGGERIVDMSFLVHERGVDIPKLPRLYTNFNSVGPDEAPTLLSEVEVLGATTHEAEILSLTDLMSLFASRGKSALLGQDNQGLDNACHVHRDSENKPFVCWAGFTPTLQEMLTIVKAWTVLNAANAISDGTIDANQVDNPLDLIEHFHLNVQIVVAGAR